MIIPIAYTIGGCPACDKLRATWRELEVEYDERRTDLNQAFLDEALEYGHIVPIILWPDGRVDQGEFEGVLG
jgi:hypothetical protein